MGDVNPDLIISGAKLSDKFDKVYMLKEIVIGINDFFHKYLEVKVQ